MTTSSSDDRQAPPATLPPDVDEDAAARGRLYGLLARAFTPPEATLHTALRDGSFAKTVEQLLAVTSLDVEPVAIPIDDDHDLLSARYHDLFVIGYAEYEDRTDGTLSASAPPVPLYETAYRPDASWGDVNLDLARAYDYFGIEIDGRNREHHDHLPLQLEFAGYLARREAAVDDSAGAARLDLLDRHLRIFVEGVRDRIADEPGTQAYAPLVELLDTFSAADRDDLAQRVEGAP